MSHSPVPSRPFSIRKMVAFVARPHLVLRKYVGDLLECDSPLIHVVDPTDELGPIEGDAIFDPHQHAEQLTANLASMLHGTKVSRPDPHPATGMPAGFGDAP